MTRLLSLLVRCILYSATCSAAVASVRLDRSELVFSGVHGATSAPLFVTLFNDGTADASPLTVRIGGADAAAFAVFGSPGLALKPLEARSVGLVLCPPDGRIGPLVATCEMVGSKGEVFASLSLHGLSAIGLEGPRESPLDEILAVLGYAVDNGWTGLRGNLNAEPMGAEIHAPRFQRAAPGDVHMVPVARYSPDFLLPFGYYVPAQDRPELVVIGTLARATAERYEQNCLFPTVATGGTRFDPGPSGFGLFTASPTHIAYTEDALNSRLEPSHVAHAVRVYPARDRAGRSLANVYLVCFEEATNGDYQDYVFLLSNVTPVNP